jgi:hypothetical protein
VVIVSCLEGAFGDPNIRFLLVVVFSRYRCLVYNTLRLALTSEGAGFFFATVAIFISWGGVLVFFGEQMLVV